MVSTKLNGVKHWVKIDLGQEKEFNTYTLYNTRSKEGFGNTTEWEVLVAPAMEMNGHQ